MFFEAERQRFFRPVNSSRRELVVACLRTLYERLHGPQADYAHNMTRDSLRELLLPVVREHQSQVSDDAPPDDFNAPEAEDPSQLTALVVRSLLADGWLESFADRQGLVTAFRFSRPGKLFAHAFASLDRPSRSRQRNMRSCRNALESALARGDAYDLVDAYEYAEKVIEDLNEGIDYFQELLRHVMQTATASQQWEEFVEFLRRFQRDFAKQLTADNVTLNRQAIRQNIEKLRHVPEARFERMNAHLNDMAHWLVKDHSGASAYDWVLTRIEDIVDAACDSKQPGFLKAMETYLKRVNGLALQSMMLRSGQTRHAYLAAIQRIAESTEAGQDELLERIGQQIAGAEVRLLDPASFKLRTATQRRKAVTVTLRPRPTWESRRDAAVRRAESEVFSVSNVDLAARLRADLRLFRHPIRLSALPASTAREVISIMQTVEAARSAADKDLVARKLPYRLENEFYSGNDYEISFKE
ncbi:hypothetical protein H6P1_00322 (plasmid) [Variovorax sp. PBL-H6]|nr:hypothetical protein H6P1_00322 [Variovorax sp. PBL-H6]VTU43618.1 hypothetical protein E5P1_00577 [Variovorax sp. PBL-E5]